MLVMHRHPDNKGATPKLVNSTQRVYPRTGVDANSRWRVHWDAVGQADMSAGIDSMSLKHVVVAVQCEEGDLTIECKSAFCSASCYFLALALACAGVSRSLLTIRAIMATHGILDPPPPQRSGRFSQRV